jgi:transcriptional regulator GlxA family with amidase domain
VVTTPYFDDDLLRRLVRARTRMRDDLGSPLTLGVLAREACLSGHHFMRTFKAAFGLTPGRHLGELRIARAKELLARGTSVTETCFAVGYASLGTFSRRFKLTTGLSPREFQIATRAFGAVPARLWAVHAPACFAARFFGP